VDGRGVTKSYTYNNLGLVTQVDYTVPSGSTIPAYSYDDFGNRTQMTDGLGTVDYVYDELSRLESENRIFTDPLADAPSGGFKLEYDYTLSGQLKSYKDPYGQQINMGYDKVGRLLSVTGTTAFAGVTSYSSNAEYRAWNDLKKLEFGNGLTQETTYNNLLRPENFKLKKADNSLKMDKNYDYYADGSLKKLNDLIESAYDRLNKYDHIGRIKEGKAGIFARNETHDPDENDNPYTKTYNDAFGNLKGDLGGYWGHTTLTYNYDFDTKDRVTTQSYNGTSIDSAKTWQYDAEGRPLRSYDEFFKKGKQQYDAAGNLVKLEDFANAGAARNETTLHQNGSSGAGKRAFRYTSDGTTWETSPNEYYVTSSALGAKSWKQRSLLRDAKSLHKRSNTTKTERLMTKRLNGITLTRLG